MRVYDYPDWQRRMIRISESIPRHTVEYQSLPYGQKTIVFKMYLRLIFLAEMDGRLDVMRDLVRARGSRQSGVDKWGWPVRDRMALREPC